MTITTAAKRTLQTIAPNIAEEMLLDSYVMHRSRQRCLTCDCIEAYSTIFEVWTHPTRTARTGLRSLKVQVGALRKELDFAIVDLPERTIPLCSDCSEEYTTSGDPIPPITRDAWEATLRRKYAPQPSADSSRSESAKAKAPSLEDL